MQEIEKNGPDKEKKRRIIILGIIFAVVAIIITTFYIHYNATHISTDDAYVEGNIHTIASKVGGTVKTVHIKDNQFVKKNDLLVEIDTVDYDVRVRESTAAYEAQQAKSSETAFRLDAARKQALQLKAGIESARANKDLADANLRQAKIDMKRAEALLAGEAISKDRYDRTKTALDVGEAQLRAAVERIRELEAAYQTQQASIKQAEAGANAESAMVQSRKATLDSAMLNKGYTKILAPADGYITKKSVEIGNQIAPGQPLCAIVPLDDIWITANYKETQLEKIRTGQKVKIKVDTYSGKTFDGVVESIQAGTGASFSLFPPENATGNYVKVVQRIPVKVVLDKNTDKDHVLRIGMSVTPTVLVR